MQVGNTPYFDVFYQPGESPVFSYRSGMTVYEEQLSGGILAAAGWNGAGYPLNVLSNVPSRLHPRAFREPSSFALEADGKSLAWDLTLEDFACERQEESLHAVITLRSGVAPVRIRVHTVLDGTAMFTRYLEVENLGEAPLSLSRMTVLGGGLETMQTPQLTDSRAVETYYSLGYFDHDAWGREGAFAWHDLVPAITTVDSRYSADRYRHPVIFLRNNLLGKTWFAQIAWSGGCRFTADYAARSETGDTRLAFAMDIAAHNPMLVLRPGEVFTTPAVHMGMVQGGLDEAVNEMHSHIRRSVLSAPEADPSACLVGAGMGAEHDMSVETSKAFMRHFAEMGAEIFIIDAGWQNPPATEMQWFAYNGINRPDPDRYPDGISELSDYCHSLGMKFAMWVEIERLGERCGAYTAHPEWRAHDIYGEQEAGILDMTVPEAAAWAEEELARIITEYRLDLLRVDYNVSTDGLFTMRDTGTGVRECLSLRHMQAVYRMYRNLKKRFPHVIFENCAGGGGRTDLGMMQAFHHTWVSDWQNMPRSVLITGGMTMALPPERVDRLFAGMGCHAFGAFDAHMRNIMLGHMSLNVVAPAAARANPLQMDFIRHSVRVYKDFIRPMLPTARIYHHTPEAARALSDGLHVLEIASPDGSRGALTAITLSAGGERTVTLRLRGADPARVYRVTLDNTGAVFTASGRELAMTGLTVSIPAAMGSELVLYEAVEA